MSFTVQITMAAPIGMRDDCNALGLVIGESQYDDEIFGDPKFEDSEGNLYCVTALPTYDYYMERMEGELVAPSFAPDVDLEAARRAAAVLDLEGEATPTTFAVKVNTMNYPVGDQIYELGLTRIS